MRLARLSHLSRDRSRKRSLVAAVVAAALLATSLSSVASARTRPAADPVVINDWSAVAVATIVTDAGKGNAEGFMWLGFVQAAVYDAVVGITGRYQPYKWHPDKPHGASPQAAAAAAAHRILLNYFPASQVRLDTALATSLAQVPDGRAKDRGIAFGKKAADRIIALRTGDGRNALITFTLPPAPGVWRPSPPANAPFFDPWLSQVRPLMLRSPTQFRPGDPPALTSATYTKEFNEVKTLGSATSTLRTAAQTETALYINGYLFGFASAALRDLATRRNMDISERARMFAAVDMSMADAVISAWDSKLFFHWWRPLAAIQLADTDGNLDTLADTTWVPLIVTPPYPDYVSGLTTVTGAAVRALTRVLGTSRLDLNIPSSVTGTTRHYVFASDINRDAIDARVWSGIHFRTADVVGSKMGRKIGNWALDHYFKPTHNHGDDH